MVKRRKIVKKAFPKEQNTFSVDYYKGRKKVSQEFKSASKARECAMIRNFLKEDFTVIENRFFGKPSRKTFFKDRQLVARGKRFGNFGSIGDIRGKNKKRK